MDINDMMRQIAAGVRNPTYQNPPPEPTNAPAPRPPSFGELEQAMGRKPSGAQAGPFNSADINESLGRYLDSSYSGGGMREKAGVYGEPRPRQTDALKDAIRTFTGNGEVPYAQDVLRRRMAPVGDQSIDRDPRRLAREVYGNSNAYAAGEPNYSVPARTPPVTAGEGFDMPGPHSDIGARPGSRALTVVPRAPEPPPPGYEPNFTMNGPSSDIGARPGSRALTVVPEAGGAGGGGRGTGFFDDLASMGDDFGRLRGFLGDKVGAVAGALSNPYTRTALRVAGPVGAAIGGYNTVNELMDENSDPRRRFAAAGDAFSAGHYGDAAKNAYYGVGDVVGQLTGLKPLAQMLFQPAQPEQPKPITYDAATQSFSRAPTNMAEYEQMQKARQQAAYPGGVTQGGVPLTNFDNVSGMGPATASDLRGAYARLNQQQAPGAAAPGGNAPSSEQQRINQYLDMAEKRHLSPAMFNAALDYDSQMRGLQAQQPLRDAQADYYRTPKPVKGNDLIAQDLNRLLQQSRSVKLALMSPELQRDPQRFKQAQLFDQFLDKQIIVDQQSMRGDPYQPDTRSIVNNLPE